jgi:hypothetical protein
MSGSYLWGGFKLHSNQYKLHTKRQQVHISMFRNLLQLTNSVAIGF